MNPTDALWRSLPVSLAAALFVAAIVAFAKRRHKPLAAAFEHALWTCVLAAMLAFAVPGIKVHAGPPLTPPIVRDRPVPPATVIMPADPPAVSILAPARTSPVRRPVWHINWSLIWLAGAAWMTLRIFVGIFLTRRSLVGSRAIQSEVPVECAAVCRVHESDNAFVPMTVGWPSPRIILPTAWRSWPAEKLRAIMLHELAHVSRHDTLVTLLAAVNKAIFWFHPLAWWLERRLAELAEFAADDAALQKIIDRRGYAEILVEIASNARPARLRLHPVSVDFAQRGVRRVNRRLDRIFDAGARVGSMKIVWAAATVIAVLTLVQFERPVRAQTPPRAAIPVENSSAAPGQSRQQIDDTVEQFIELARRRHELEVHQKPGAGSQQQNEIEAKAEYSGLIQLYPDTAEGRQLTAKQRQAKEDALKQELMTPYKKWMDEDVVYIISDEERKAFRQLNTDEEREQFVEQFWLRRDPTPDTEENEFKEEHYRRIAYANEHYASSIPGWRTDRGRIYIQYGPPDTIEAHSSGGSYRRPPEEGGGVTETFPFEKWGYRNIAGVGQNIFMEFVDTAMNGEYRLTMDPNTKDALHLPTPALPKR